MTVQFFFGRVKQNVALKFDIGTTPGFERAISYMYGVSFGRLFFGTFYTEKLDQAKAFKILSQKKAR